MIILSLLLWPLYPHSCQPLFLKFRVVYFLCVTSRANAGSVMLTAEERGWTQTCFRDVCKCSADCAVVFLLDGIFYSYFRALRSAGTNRWSCLQSDWLPSAAELFRSPLPTPGTLFLNTSFRLLRCSHLSVI